MAMDFPPPILLSMIREVPPGKLYRISLINIADIAV